MSRTYTKREIAYDFDCSTRTVSEDEIYLNIKPDTSPGRSNLYSEKDYQLIKQMRQHMSVPGNTRDTFVASAIPEIVDEEEQTVTKHESSIVEYTQAEQIELMAESDPFFDLKIMYRLQEIADNKWSMPTKFMATLLRITPATLLKYHQYPYASFAISIDTPPVIKLRSEPTKIIEPKAILWRVDANNG